MLWIDVYSQTSKSPCSICEYSRLLVVILFPFISVHSVELYVRAIGYCGRDLTISHANCRSLCRTVWN